MPTYSRKRTAALLTGLILLVAGCHRAASMATQSGLDAVPAITAEQLFRIGILQAQRGDLLRAEQYLSAAQARGYDHALTTYWLVRVCVSGGRYHSALRHAAPRLDRDPYEWRLRLVVASIHQALGDLERARSELERVVNHRPEEALPRYRLAMIYRDDPVLGDRAIEHLSRYLELDPDGAHAEQVRSMLGSGLDPAALSNPDISGSTKEPTR